MKLNQLYQNFQPTAKSKIESLVKKTITFGVDSTIPQILPKLNRNRTEIFALHNGLCYFINSRTVLNKKKINESMQVRSILNTISHLKKTDSIEDAIEIFLHYKVNSIPVMSDEHIIGEIQILSVIEKMIGIGLSDITLDKLELTYSKVSHMKSLSTARKKLKENQVDVIPVEKEKKIIQVVTSNHIISTLNPPQRVGTLGTIGKTKIRSLEPQIGNIGTKVFPRLTTDDSIEYAVKLMLKQNVRYFIVDSLSTPNQQSLVTSHDIISLCYKKNRKKIPIYIVGNENRKLSDRHVSRLEPTLKIFSKSVDEILEARIVIEEQRTSGLETKFHMKLLLITSRNQLSFSSKTWSIEEGLANLAEMISGKIASKKKTRNRKSIRKTSKSEILAKRKF